MEEPTILTMDYFIKMFPGVEQNGLTPNQIAGFFPSGYGNKQISGKCLNMLFSRTIFVKYLKENHTQVMRDSAGLYHRFTYNIGPNSDTNEYRPFDRVPGGLYFTIPLYLDKFENFGSKLCVIEIPDDARVYIAFKCFKVDKLVVKDILSTWDLEKIIRDAQMLE